MHIINRPIEEPSESLIIKDTGWILSCVFSVTDRPHRLFLASDGAFVLVINRVRLATICQAMDGLYAHLQTITTQNFVAFTGFGGIFLCADAVLKAIICLHQSQTVCPLLGWQQRETFRMNVLLLAQKDFHPLRLLRLRVPLRPPSLVRCSAQKSVYHSHLPRGRPPKLPENLSQ